MSDTKGRDPSHEVLSDMAKKDAEQPGDTPSDSPPNVEGEADETEDAPRESD